MDHDADGAPFGAGKGDYGASVKIARGDILIKASADPDRRISSQGADVPAATRVASHSEERV